MNVLGDIDPRVIQSVSQRYGLNPAVLKQLIDSAMSTGIAGSLPPGLLPGRTPAERIFGAESLMRDRIGLQQGGDWMMRNFPQTQPYNYWKVGVPALGGVAYGSETR